MGIEIEWRRVRELADGAVGRPHIAQALVEKGYITYPSEAFQKYIGHDGPAYVGRPKATPEDAIALIKKYKGIPVLAHPREMGGAEEIVPELAKAGLEGMEIYYKDYASSEINSLLSLAQSYNLIPCGGTDYHAVGEPGEILPGFTGPPIESVHQIVSLARAIGSPVVT
jgi:predicted metal-dependent phosphoesterase TrpH